VTEHDPRMHVDEVSLTDAMVRGLVTNQFPEWTDLPIRRISSTGTVNAIFRIGNDLAARFPLRRRDPDSMRQILEAEAKASSEFNRHSPFAGPTPVAIGEPGEGYPMPWSVQSWLNGTTAEDGSAAGSASFARDLATLITALRRVDTAGRSFEHGWRGGDLRNHDAWVQKCFRESRAFLDVPRLAALWSYFVQLPRTSPDVMSHGDLIPSNVLVTKGRLTGLLDCGGFGPADPALDVIAGWHLLDDGARAVFREELAPDELEWERSKAWAFEQSMGAVWYYVHTNPAMSEMGRCTLSRILADTPFKGVS
jgi:aminoglycoside phosphotransferase (APT) family kinase protein